MEQNTPIIAKRIWGMVRIIYYMVRKGILSKRKLLLDLNMFLKRGNQIASKAVDHLLYFNHHHQHGPGRHVPQFHSSNREYEFSCSNTPSYTLPFHLTKKARNHHHNTNNFFAACAFHAPTTLDDYYYHDANNKAMSMSAVKLALEMLQDNGNISNDTVVGSLTSPSPMWKTPAESPWLPGFGRSPAVRQLRITDSPFPLRDDDCDNGVVDKKAEEFIQRFYRQLRQQKRE